MKIRSKYKLQSYNYNSLKDKILPSQRLIFANDLYVMSASIFLTTILLFVLPTLKRKKN